MVPPDSFRRRLCTEDGMTARLLLTRHGETIWHAENRYAGTSDVPLTDQGIAQARELGRWAARHHVDALACSPLTRARETAAQAARELGREPVVRDGLREADFGWAEGRTAKELSAEAPETMRAFDADAEAGAFPGSERPSAVAARTTAVLHELAEAHPEETVLVVAHNTALRAALCALLGIPVGRYRLVLPRLENAAITEIELSHGETALHSLNVPTALSLE